MRHPDLFLNQDAREHAERELSAKIHDAAAEIGFKRCAEEIGEAQSTIANQLARRDGKQPSADLLVFCLRWQSSERLMKWLMRAVGYEMPERLQKPDDAVKLASYRAELRALLSKAKAAEIIGRIEGAGALTEDE